MLPVSKWSQNSASSNWWGDKETQVYKLKLPAHLFTCSVGGCKRVGNTLCTFLTCSLDSFHVFLYIYFPIFLSIYLYANMSEKIYLKFIFCIHFVFSELVAEWSGRELDSLLSAVSKCILKTSEQFIHGKGSYMAGPQMTVVVRAFCLFRFLRIGL